MAIYESPYINVQGQRIRFPGLIHENFEHISEVLHNVRPEDILSYEVENRVETMSRMVTVSFMLRDSPNRHTEDTRDETQTDDYLTRIGIR